MEHRGIRVFVGHLLSNTNHTILEAATILATRGKEVHSELAFLDSGQRTFVTVTSLLGQGIVVSDVCDDEFYGVVQTDLQVANPIPNDWEWQDVTGLLPSPRAAEALREWCTTAKAPYDISAYPGEPTRARIQCTAASRVRAATPRRRPGGVHAPPREGRLIWVPRQVYLLGDGCRRPGDVWGGRDGRRAGGAVRNGSNTG